MKTLVALPILVSILSVNNAMLIGRGPVTIRPGGTQQCPIMCPSQKNKAFVLTSLLAQDLPVGRGHEALPRAFLEAKTVNLVDYSGYEVVGDALKWEIEDWGRYTIAENPEDADLMFVISCWQKTISPPDSDSNAISPVGGPVPEATAGATSGRFVLEVNDNKTGTPLWSAYHKRARFRSAVRALLDELRAQIEAADTSL